MNKDFLISPGKLTVARARACMSAAQLARVANVSRDTVTRIYRGNGAPVRVSCTTAGKLARALKIDVLNLMEQ